MKKCLIILLFVFVTCNEAIDTFAFQEFQKFITKYHKNYESINEYLERFKIFKSNLVSILSEKDKLSYEIGITEFSDLTRQEFKKIYSNGNLRTLTSFAEYIPSKKIKDYPESFDWRDKGVSVPCTINERPSCNDRWAILTTINLNCLYYINKGTWKSFSSQMLIDCDTYDSGCSGGLMEYTFSWLKDNGGINYEDDYPYEGAQGSCRADPSKYSDMKVTGYKLVGGADLAWTCGDEEEMKKNLYDNGPLIAMVNSFPLLYYFSGIIDLSSDKCPSSGIDLSVLIVGYGNDSSSGLDYWIVENFWGEAWGESGYFRISRGKGTCGINCYAITGLVSFD